MEDAWLLGCCPLSAAEVKVLADSLLHQIFLFLNEAFFIIAKRRTQETNLTSFFTRKYHPSEKKSKASSLKVLLQYIDMGFMW
jgi:hypothetical protein